MGVKGQIVFDENGDTTGMLKIRRLQREYDSSCHTPFKINNGHQYKTFEMKIVSKLLTYRQDV